MPFTRFKFSRSWLRSEDFPSYEDNEAKVRADMQALPDELLGHLNRHIEEETASNIRFAPTAGVASENVQQAVECVQSQLIGISQSGIADGSVSSEKLADNAVTLPKLAPGSVGEAQLIPGAVTAEKLSPASVGAEALAPYSVTAEKLGTDCVTGDHEIEEGREIVTLHGKLSSACVAKRNIRPGAVGEEETDGSLQPRHRLMTLELDFAGESSVSVSAPGLPADADIIVSPDPLSYTEWAECLVRCSAQREGSLSFAAETPPGAPLGARVLVLE